MSEFPPLLDRCQFLPKQWSIRTAIKLPYFSRKENRERKHNWDMSEKEEKDEETRSYWKRFGNHERAKQNAIIIPIFEFRRCAQIFFKKKKTTLTLETIVFFGFRQENVSKKLITASRDKTNNIFWKKYLFMHVRNNLHLGSHHGPLGTSVPLRSSPATSCGHSG